MRSVGGLVVSIFAFARIDNLFCEYFLLKVHCLRGRCRFFLGKVLICSLLKEGRSFRLFDSGVAVKAVITPFARSFSLGKVSYTLFPMKDNFCVISHIPLLTV